MKIQKIIEIKEALDFMAKTGDVSKIALDNLTTGLEELDEQLTIPDVVLQSEQVSFSDIYKIAQGYTEEQFIEMVNHIKHK